MSGDDAVTQAVLRRLAEVPLLHALPAELQRDLASAMECFLLPGGALLFEQDSPSDALYVLLAGRLLARRRHPDGSQHLAGVIAAGECVGETGLIANAPRNASVQALRDSELLRLPRAAFERLLARHPQAMLDLARSALRRFAQVAPREPRPRCFALLPAHAGLPLQAVAEGLLAELRRFGRCEAITAEQGRGRPPAFFTEREAGLAHLLLLGDEDPVWRSQCVRQCDCVLLLAEAGSAPQPPPLPPAVGPANRHLLLRHAGRIERGAAADWERHWPELRRVHHLRNDSDLPRVARLVSGRAVSLCLSGGGARGFAHLGVVRALREAGIGIDAVGGTSIGAIVAAGVAADWDDARLREAFEAFFVRQRPLSDWTLPLVALARGRRASRLLREAFGERAIEDLALPFLAVSADLGSGELMLHERGGLWQALRASSAIPGLLPPVFEPGRILVDGGVLDNLPVAELRRRARGACLAVDVSSGFPPRSELEEDHLPPWWRSLFDQLRGRRRPGIGQLLLRAGMLTSDTARRSQRRQASFLLQPPLSGIELLGWRDFERAEAIGYRHASEHMDLLRVALQREQVET